MPEGYMPECPMHKETDGTPMNAIWRDRKGYYHCRQCLDESFENFLNLQRNYELFVHKLKEMGIAPQKIIEGGS